MNLKKKNPCDSQQDRDILGAYPTTYPSQSRCGDNLKSH